MQTETDIDLGIPPALAAEAPRRLDVDAKQHLVAQLLHDCECEGLLVLHPPNFRWLTTGGQPVGLYGRDEVPALYFNAHQRWLVASATDTPRLFAEELDGLGFMLKEWHWTTSREQMLADLVFGRKVACDQPFRDCKYTGTFFASGRRKLSSYEADRLAELGQMVTHAVEATARNLDWGDPEDEIAGQLAHRLFRHGVEPVVLQVSGDGRGRAFRRRGARGEPVEHWCVVQATGRKFGLHATAARTVLRHPIDPDERDEFEVALRCRVAHLAMTKVGERVAVAFEAAKAVLRPTPHEHEWRAAPPVCLTGREPSEGVFLPAAQDRWARGWAAVWQERVGAMAVADTYVLGEDGWRMATPAGDWPVRRASSQGRSFELPDVLLRAD
jgi:Xaa-Pro dipeptidase